MAITYVDLTGNIADLVGTDFDYRRTKVWIETNIEGDVIIDPTNNQIRLGDAKADVDTAGDFTFTGLVATNSTTNPTAFQYRVWIDYATRRPAGPRAQWDSGWFSLTATSDLADVTAEQYAPPTWQSTFMTDAQALLDAQIAISGIDDTDSAVAGLIEDPLVGPLTNAALSTSTADSIEPGETDPQAAVGIVADRRVVADRVKQNRAETFVNWTTKTNGSRPTALDSGHAIQYDKNSNPNSAYDIIGNKLSNAATSSNYASYATALGLSAAVKRIGAEFTLGAGGGFGGICLAIWNQQPGARGVFPTVVPEASLHLEVYADHWVLSYFSGGGTGVTATATTVKNVTFGANLATDGTTKHRIDVLMYDSIVVIMLPDGSIGVATDTHFNGGGTFPCWEIQASDAATQSKAAFINGWADTALDYRDQANFLSAVARQIRTLDVSNTESGTGRVLSGLRNTASGTGAVIPGGDDNTAASNYSRAGGHYSKVRAQGHDVFAGGRFSASGDAQAGFHNMRVTTTDATPTTLSVTGTAGTAGLIPATAQAIACSALVSAYRSSNGESAMYRVDFAVKRTTSGSTAIVGTPVVTVLYEDDSTWDVAPYANSALDVWGLQVTGAASKTLHWNAQIRAVEVT